MIATLHIKNIGIINDIIINFNKGFNVLTGETGAGKSLIIKSIDILSGSRVSKDIIRKDQEYLLVEACIYDEKSENEAIISREVYQSGRNLCKIDGRLVTVSELKAYMKDIVDIHGQYDNQNLMDAKEHINFVDAFSKDELNDKLKEYKEYLYKYNEIKKELKKNYGNDIERQRKLDLLRYQLNEIIEANLSVNEEESLNDKKKILQNSEKITEGLTLTKYKLEEQVIDSLDEIIISLSKISSLDVRYDNYLKEVQDAYYALTDTLDGVSNILESLEFDEDENNLICSRLELINNLKRKYGNSISEILDYSNNIEKQIAEIENLEEYNNKLKVKQSDIEDKLLTIGKDIHNIRAKYSNILEDSVNKELKALEMKNARFKINILYDEKNFKENGLDTIEFLISTNIGEEYKPLSKIASGGEIARIMLSIKSVLSDVDKVPVMIFDEIDTGISGATVKAVGKKLKNISLSHQVFVITHQPILTAIADYNYMVYKVVESDNTNTKVKLLNEDERINEIARISSGDITKSSINHAMELRKTCLCI